MAVQIRGNGISVTDELRDYAEQRIARLDRLVSTVDERKLELRHNHSKSGPDTVTAQLTLQTGKTLLRAEEADPDAKLAIDRAVDKLVGQVRKVHSKRARRTGKQVATIRVEEAALEATDEVEVADRIESTDRDGDEPSTVVRTKRFDVKPMDVDEAIERMELLGHDFFLFQSVEEEHLCLVYRRRGGDYGLLVPDQG